MCYKFLDLYKKTERNTKNLKLKPITTDDVRIISKEFSEIGKMNIIKLEIYSENIDLYDFSIKKGKCIDDELIEKILSCKLKVGKDKIQVYVCVYAASVEIAQNNTCRHHCTYCYANFNYETVEKNTILYNIKLSILILLPTKDDKIATRDMKSICIKH